MCVNFIRKWRDLHFSSTPNYRFFINFFIWLISEFFPEIWREETRFGSYTWPVRMEDNVPARRIVNANISGHRGIILTKMLVKQNRLQNSAKAATYLKNWLLRSNTLVKVFNSNGVLEQR